MIRVNLLPQEYRKAESTPLKQFFATVGAVIVVALAVVFYVLIHFGKLQPKEQELDTMKVAVATQQAQVKESKELASWVQEYKTQYDKIDKVAMTRVLWSRKLDEIWEVVVNPVPVNKYDVWLRGLNGKVVDAPKTGGEVQFSGASAGSQVFRLSDFHESVTTNDLFKEFQSITYPSGNREALPGTDREPKEGWTFQFTLVLRPLKELNDMRTKATADAGGKK
jgi:Tfp pilus assembly protein PilN